MPDRSRCPNCKERVSPYAAGCAVCGADLDHRRWDTGPSKLAQTGSWLSSFSYGPQKRVPPLVVLFVIFFGGSVIAAIVALVASVL
jgi:predicted amidophosphoribosyltransferase